MFQPAGAGALVSAAALSFVPRCATIAMAATAARSATAASMARRCARAGGTRRSVADAAATRPVVARRAGCRARRAARRSPRTGAPLIGSRPAWFFGNAMTSRRFGSPASTMTVRSIPSAMPPCGGAPMRERVEQEAELRALLLRAQRERVEDTRLELGLVDPEGAAAELVAVHDEVVRLRERCARAPRRSGRAIRPSGG